MTSDAPPAETDAPARATSVAGIAAEMIDAEAERRALQAKDEQETLFADDLLPGVGGDGKRLSLRQGLAAGGSVTFLTLMTLGALDELESATLQTLAPNIRDSFHLSDGAITVISAASGAFLVLGALPMGWAADRFRRSRVIGWAGVAFSAMVFASGLAGSAFLFFLARFGVGIAKSSNQAVHGSLLADTYPIGVRGRIASTNYGAARAAGALSPAVVGGIAALAGGADGWRWPYLLLGFPALAVAIFAFRLPEPARGQHEMQSVLGEVLEDAKPLPISIEAAFARLMRIRTIKTSILAFSALGFSLFSSGVLQNLWADDHFHMSTFQRGVWGSVGGASILLALPFVGPRYDDLYHRKPDQALRLLGLFILPTAVLLPIQWFMPNGILFMVAGIPGVMASSVAFSMISPVLQSVTPYRLRGLGLALSAIYVFFIGATGGALLSGLISNAYDPRVAVLVIGIPASAIGGWLMIRGASFIKNDLSLVVADLREELEERDRQVADPENIPLLQVNNIDFSYGHVQVLFGVAFEVRRGETLALLGTNGAGKSTILKVIAGLGTPSRGVVRMNGRTMTYVSPEQRGRYGIHLLPGGKGVFASMSIRDNLEMAAFRMRNDVADRDRRFAYVLDLFPDLAARQNQRAGSLSGGQQQMLALAMVLLQDPEVLLIDELSLGLAPVVVQDLLAIVERLKRDGMTIIIVEQSLNIALAIADRAVFLEKGQVRFTGPARELAERDDLARAVFLGREGG
ncbi:MFS transporter [Frankia sp. AgB1.9]|uniref:ATP-binding protein n=1 Tax=unclassified Frankia TaxID=2632575 RepID=UPI001933B049|nr:MULTISPECIES: ATP-binding protein [unclassified Frankia]MBL7493815.1 MFS transporter [Frankia sp. AgW1.1]MBL7550494.1 MFS transporter [Frankia sp. AgB1.9]MBL7624308.1 MFS transporter [Frankia sp. AgB1.8]